MVPNMTEHLQLFLQQLVGQRILISSSSKSLDQPAAPPSPKGAHVRGKGHLGIKPPFLPPPFDFEIEFIQK